MSTLSSGLTNPRQHLWLPWKEGYPAQTILLGTSGLSSTRTIWREGVRIRHKGNFLPVLIFHIVFPQPSPTVGCCFLSTQRLNLLFPRVSHRIFVQVTSEVLSSVSLSCALSGIECAILKGHFPSALFFHPSLPLSIYSCRFSCLTVF